MGFDPCLPKAILEGIADVRRETIRQSWLIHVRKWFSSSEPDMVDIITIEDPRNQEL